MSVNIFQNGVLQKIAGAVGDAVPLINNFLTNQPGKGAADANTVYQLKNELNSVNDSLGGIQFGIDENGNYGYIKAGADSVTPFSGVNVLHIGGLYYYYTGYDYMNLYDNDEYIEYTSEANSVVTITFKKPAKIAIQSYIPKRGARYPWVVGDYSFTPTMGDNITEDINVKAGDTFTFNYGWGDSNTALNVIIHLK